MAFGNPFDDPQGAFYIAQCAGAIQSVAATMRLTSEAGTLCVSRVTGVLPAVAGSPLAYSDTDEFYPVAGGTMSQHLPLVAAQPASGWQKNCQDYPPFGRGALR